MEILVVFALLSLSLHSTRNEETLLQNIKIVCLFFSVLLSSTPDILIQSSLPYTLTLEKCNRVYEMYLSTFAHHPRLHATSTQNMISKSSRGKSFTNGAVKERLEGAGFVLTERTQQSEKSIYPMPVVLNNEIGNHHR